VREKFNSQLSFIDVSSYSADDSNSFSLDTLNTDLPKLKEFSKINVNVSTFSFDNNNSTESMLPHLYSYIDNLNTIIIKQKSFLNDFSGNKYFKAYRDKMSKAPVGSISNIHSSGGHKLNISNSYVVPTVQAIDSSADNNSCI